MTSTAFARAKDAARYPGLYSGSAASIAAVSGTAGDHPAVQLFLSSVFRDGSGLDFQSQLDEPDYEPSDRLLIKHRQNVVAHLRLASRQMRFGTVTLPVSCVANNATLPEFRNRGYASALLEAAECKMAQDGALLGVLRTSEPTFYRRRGWMVCGRHSYSTVGCHQMLAHLRPRVIRRPGMPVAAKPPALHIRYLRRVELAAVIRMHHAQTRQAYGVYTRTNAFWRWLINRCGYDRIYVAIEGSPEIELDGTFAAIVGYAAARNARLVELVSASHRPDAGPQLLARFCGDAIEQDLREVRVDLSPDHPIHDVIVAAGGDYCREELDRGQAFMVKVLDPERLVQRLHPEFLARLDGDKLVAHRELGFVVGDQSWILEVTPRTSRLSAGRARRTFMRCSAAQFCQMLLGHLDACRAVQNGQMSVSNRFALESALTLVPMLPLWFPLLDDLPAQ